MGPSSLTTLKGCDSRGQSLVDRQWQRSMCSLQHLLQLHPICLQPALRAWRSPARMGLDWGWQWIFLYSHLISFWYFLILFVFLSSHSPGGILGTTERSAAWTLPRRYIWKQSSFIGTRLDKDKCSPIHVPGDKMASNQSFFCRFTSARLPSNTKVTAAASCKDTPVTLSSSLPVAQFFWAARKKTFAKIKSILQRAWVHLEFEMFFQATWLFWICLKLCTFSAFPRQDSISQTCPECVPGATLFRAFFERLRQLQLVLVHQPRLHATGSDALISRHRSFK